MKISPTRPSAARIAIVAALLAGVAVPVLAPLRAQDTPESLLPPGFNDPAPAPAPAPAPRPSGPAAPRPTAAPVAPPSIPADSPDLFGNDSAPLAEATPAPIDYSKYELPDFAKRSLNRIGVSAWGNPVFAPNAFAGTPGRAQMILMQRLDAPIPSRWVSIALRRALQSPIDTPAGINGADYAAQRAWLLLRMGESFAARAVVQGVDAENFTPGLYRVGMQVALAAADPAMVCGFADPAAQELPDRGWQLARAWCAGLGGEPNKAQALLKEARSGPRGDIDNLLAEKLVNAGGRGAVTIEWGGVDGLSAWRWGLATATGETVPDALYSGVGPQVRFWQALAPMVPAAQRIAPAELAAANGVFSNAGLVSLYGEIEQEDDGGAFVATARDLRTAHTGPDAAARVAALKTIWVESDSARRRYGRLVLTARAASAIPARPELAADADTLIASMLTAGFEQPALAWRSVAPRGGSGWMLLALTDPSGAVAGGDFEAYRGAASPRAAQLAFAGLAGLGKLSDGDARSYAQSLDVPVGAQNSWTRAIDEAAARGDTGSVALLAAVGMQSRGWGAISPEALFHIVAAFRTAGMPQYARMIAVEAVTRA